MRAGFSVPVIAPDGSAPSLPASRASPISAEEKSSSIWVFCCLSSLRLMAYCPLLLVRAFGHRFRLGLSLLRLSAFGVPHQYNVSIKHIHTVLFPAMLG